MKILTINAAFENGTFRPLDTDALPFSHGQRLKLSIEIPETKLINQLHQTLLASVLTPSDAATVSKLQTPFPVFVPKYPPVIPPMTTPEAWFYKALELMYVPPIIPQTIRRNVIGIWERIIDYHPAENLNGVQRFIRAALTITGNISSLIVYCALLFVAGKIMILGISPGANPLTAFGHVARNIPQFAGLILAGVLLVRLLFVISDFVKSYKIMALFGTAMALVALGKTMILLAKATSIRGIGGAVWQVFSGTLK